MGKPNWPPSLSSPHLALRCGRGSHEGHEKPGQDRSQIEPTVEAVSMLGEVATAVLAKAKARWQWTQLQPSRERSQRWTKRAGTQ
jgi:hypothetical protein